MDGCGNLIIYGYFIHFLLEIKESCYIEEHDFRQSMFCNNKKYFAVFTDVLFFFTDILGIANNIFVR